VVGCYVCLVLWANLTSPTPDQPDVSTVTILTPHKTPAKTSAASAPVPVVDTTNWQVYSNPQYQLSFLYKPGWKVLPALTKDGFTILQVDPGARYYNIKIYINPKQFYIMDGLPTTSEIIGGQTALNVSNALYGIKANSSYYTFDVGWSMSLVPDFDALVHSVKFQG